MTTTNPNPKPDARAHIYAASAAVFAVLTGYGLVSEDDAARWVQLVAALVPLASLALAWFNTPRTKGKRAK